MSPEDVAQQSVTNLAALIILTAIPVVAFALWCDYAERYLEAAKTAKAELDRTLEQYRARSSGLFVQIFQIIVFFATTPVRREHPAIAYPLFLAATLIQFALQKGLESKIRVSGQPSGESPLAQTSRTVLWSVLAGSLYVVVLVFSVIAFSAIGVLLHAPIPVQIALLVLGMSTGVAGGLSLNFALSALFVRKILNAKAITPDANADLHSSLTSMFAESGMSPPDFWLVEVPQFHLGSAVMAGFPQGKGLFQPGFFVAQELLEKLTSDEVRAVVLHEVSHLRLKHVKRRFTLSCGLIACSSLMTGVTVLFARHLSLDPPSQGVAGCIALVASFLMAFNTLARQVKFQEIAADIHSVERLGSEISSLASALRKLDRLYGALPGKLDPGTALLSLGHPSTERRIRILERYFENKARTAAVSDRQKAA